MFSVWPVASMTPKVAMREAGMPAMTQKATRTLRNVMRIRVTRIRPPVSVLDQQVDPVLEQVGGCIVSFHDEVRRQGRLDLVQVRFDGPGLQERIGTHCALNAQFDCLLGIPVHGNALFIVRFVHLCDVSKVYLPSVLVGLYFNISQCSGSRQQPQAPDLTLSIAQIARGKVL